MVSIVIEPPDPVAMDEHDSSEMILMEPATVPCRPPGPGLLLAVGWTVALLVGMTAFVIVAALATGVTDGALLVAFSTSFVVVAVVLIVGILYGRSAWSKFAIRVPTVRQLIIVTLLPTPLTVLICELTASLADACRWAQLPGWAFESAEMLAIVDEIRTYHLWTGGIAVAFFGGLLPAVGEELFFRGFLGRGLVARWGRIRGVVLTSLLFGALHIQPLHAVLAFLLGLALHAVYLWTRSLVAPILLHAVYNCEAVLGNVLIRNAHPNSAVDDHLPPLLVLTALVASMGLGWLLYRSRVRWVGADGSDWSPGFPTAEAPPGNGFRIAGQPSGPVRVAIVFVMYAIFVTMLAREMNR